jgi:hypothetical protein
MGDVRQLGRRDGAASRARWWSMALWWAMVITHAWPEAPARRRS